MGGAGEGVLQGRPRGTWPRAIVQAFRNRRGALKGALAAEGGAGRLFPWVPVALGTGISVYFALPREPALWMALPAAAVLVLGALILRRWRAFPAMVLLAAVAAGFAVATLRTERVAHGVLMRPVFATSITGFVEKSEARERSDRFVLRVESIDAQRAGVDLKRVRLSVKKGTAPTVGSHVSVRARLFPPLAPVRPGGYDFGRDLFFSGIGASGFVTGSVTETKQPPAQDLWLRYAVTMQAMRDAIDARIRLVMSGDTRAIASALLTGRRDAISAEVNDAMFVSGLGHVLSISGYHMAVVAGVVFFMIRALLALFPAARRFAVKKWAAAAALLAALYYLLLSGMEVATQRSFLMTAVVLIAIIADRRAITFRTLAIAAVVVMLFSPEAVVHPSFQMSFAATLALVAFVERGLPKLFATPENSTTARIALWGGREIVLLLVASLLAGLATLPYAAYHFHRITPYGALANLAAMPVVSGWVMPMGLLGLAAMPFGLDGIFWKLMEGGIVWMITVSQRVAALPGSVGRVTAFGPIPLALVSLGMIAFALLRSHLRWCGVLLIALAFVVAARTPQPDVQIAADGPMVAVRGADGRLAFMKPPRNAFAAREWLTADADSRLPSDKSLTEGARCDADGCTLRLADGSVVALAAKASAMSDDCRRAALIVTPYPAPRGCAARIVTQDELRTRGSIALYRRDKGFESVAARPRGSQRPWMGEQPDDAASDGALPAPLEDMLR